MSEQTFNINDFYGQNSTGSPVISWKGLDIGASYTGTVSRPLTAGDVRQNVGMDGKLSFNFNGSPQLLLYVPLRVAKSDKFPAGEATWIVNARHRDELSRAMSAAGAAAGPPAAGATIEVTLTERRPTKFSPANIVRVMYTPAVSQEQADPVDTLVANGVATVPAGLTQEQVALMARLTSK